MNGVPNYRSALDVWTALCSHIKAQRPGASESERWDKPDAKREF